MNASQPSRTTSSPRTAPAEPSSGLAGRVAHIAASDGGVPKGALAEAEVDELGIVGDRQAHPEFHGGPERALCLFGAERLAALRAEGHPIAPGAIGENLLLEGLDWAALEPGTRLALGDAVRVEITSYTVPCRTIAGAFDGGRYGRVSQTTHPGWSRLYARVLAGGPLRVGDTVRVERAG